LLDAGLTADKVNEVIGKQSFSLENATVGNLPPAIDGKA